MSLAAAKFHPHAVKPAETFEKEWTFSAKTRCRIQVTSDPETSFFSRVSPPLLRTRESFEARTTLGRVE